MSKVTHWKRGLIFEKSQLVEFLGPNEGVEFLPWKKKVDFWGSPRLCAARTWWWWLGGGRWKSCHKKIVPLSSLCRKTIKLKVDKMFRTWTKKSSSIFVFRDSYFIYVCALWTLWPFCVPVWICLFHVFMYGDVTTLVELLLPIAWQGVKKFLFSGDYLSEREHNITTGIQTR